ncbi:DUF2478 domain-containing protein [Bradyrhizobium sp. GCM10023182]|uniref:DUF2478 domain-containing protein n=1 Tax=Bradyrhizobium zhengyangense TaxID=2911009 RepID=A0ABS9LQB5_9BRAD|nr:DUF2478 domain-containing protein [Bradyrhizobium zhengyangense]MCG2638705.1 DUF2478 domain-containing protein [Bradyrhizobium zhengyangense]MCG2669086.1 DUF2478 domain-containing protein [Bradyrhizobium zhengyangense]
MPASLSVPKFDIPKFDSPKSDSPKSDPVPRPASPLTAFVYPQNSYPASVFEALVAACRGRGLMLAGVLQHVVDATPERRCDVVLEDLATGRRTPIFEDRGAGAAGCRLDEGALAEVAVNIAKSLETLPDVLVLNKFGKAECDGGGLLELIASAIERNIVVVIGVPQGNLQAWRSFAGGLGTELRADTGEVERWAQSVARLSR